MDQFKDNLRHAMKSANVTQSELADLIQCNKMSIASYLRGTVIPKSQRMYKLALALNVDMDWLSGVNSVRGSYEKLPNSNPNQFAERLAYILNKRGVTPDRLAKMCDLEPYLIRKYLSGEFFPKRAKSIKIARALHIDEIWLIYGKQVYINK